MAENPEKTKNDHISKLGQKLKTLRKKRGLRQSELADLAGINRSYLSNLENGHSSPTIEVLDRIARGLELSLADILPGGVVKSAMLQGNLAENSAEDKNRSYLNVEEKHFVYDTDEVFDIYPGLRDFLSDEDEIMLAQPTPEEVDFLKGIRFKGNFKPDARFYKEALLAYRRRRAGSSS